MYSYDAGTGATTGLQYYHADHLGSIIAMTDGATGTVADTYTYGAYGETSDPTGNPFRYTGRRIDAETGLYYYRARYYAPTLGRFLQTDPIGYGDNMNMYAYVGNDPMNATDPSGEATCADPDCKTSYIDSEIPKGPAPIDSSLEGNPEQETISVTFINDSGTNDPNQPVTTETAVMVEQALKATDGVDSVNINSTTGGSHSATSDHFKKTAVDINRINEGQVLQGQADSAPLSLVENVQDALAGQPNIRENFGPTRNEKTFTKGGKAVPTPSTAAGHKNHIHGSGHN